MRKEAQYLASKSPLRIRRMIKVIYKVVSKLINDNLARVAFSYLRFGCINLLRQFVFGNTDNDVLSAGIVFASASRVALFLRTRITSIRCFADSPFE